mgnify:CR=1 FL=1
MAVGTRIYVHGEGLGTYAGFTSRWVGANDHTIKFDSGDTKTLKLKEMIMPWAVKDSADISPTRRREESGKESEAPMKPKCHRCGTGKKGELNCCSKGGAWEG